VGSLYFTNPGFRVAGKFAAGANTAHSHVLLQVLFTALAGCAMTWRTDGERYWLKHEGFCTHVVPHQFALSAEEARHVAVCLIANRKSEGRSKPSPHRGHGTGATNETSRRACRPAIGLLTGMERETRVELATSCLEGSLRLT
jgi:hypothetical protein